MEESGIESPDCACPDTLSLSRSSSFSLLSSLFALLLQFIHSNTSPSKCLNSPPETAPKDQSNYKFLKEAGYDNMPHFMDTYGLRLGNHDDVEEAKVIRQGLKDAAQADWEAKQKQK